MKTLPVRQHFLTFERIKDEALAFDAWRFYVLAHGWSVVGEPWAGKMPEGWAVTGNVVQTERPLAVTADAKHVRFE